MRFFNNTSYKTIPAQELFNGIRHLFLNVLADKIESIELTDTKLTVFGIECILLEHDLNKPLKCIGTVRWFDELDGAGMIRLPSGESIWFYSCNAVGANSSYPELVTNVQFKEDDKVLFEISTDPYLFRACGATQIRKVA
jgi:cold shock CspA family protein